MSTAQSDLPPDSQTESLDLYLQYHFLPVEQYAQILTAVGGAVSALARIYVLDLPYLGPHESPWAVPLCVRRIETGQSIFSQFAFDARVMPYVSLNEKGEQVLHLPRWGATLVLAGYLLQWGQDRWKTQLEIEKLQHDNNKAVQEELQHFDLRKLMNSADPRVAALRLHSAHFAYEIAQPNVVSCHVNRQTVK